MLYRGPIWRGEGILNARRGDPVPPVGLTFGLETEDGDALITEDGDILLGEY